MIIECINCNKKFEVDSTLIPGTGRNIQCGSCNNMWFFKPNLKNTSEILIENNESNKIIEPKVNKKIIKKDKKTILYQSRADITGSVVCHLGEVHLKRKAKGKIINSIKIAK